MKLKNILVATTLAVLTISTAEAGFLSNLLEKQGITNSAATELAAKADTMALEATNKVAQASNQVSQSLSTNAQVAGWESLLSNKITSLSTNQALTTNQFAKLLASMRGSSTNSLSTSDLAQKLNEMFGNHFTVSNTNQWLQYVNSYLATHTNVGPALVSAISTRVVSTNTPVSTNAVAPAINQALDLFRKK